MVLGAQASPPARFESECLVADACRRGSLRSQREEPLLLDAATKGLRPLPHEVYC